MYNECISITRSFTFCPNPFRIDLYKGCDFGCKYCFANMSWVQYKDKTWDIADISRIKKLFHKALDTDCESKDILVELLRHRVPLHCGGMADPFQKREFEFGLTKQLIELSNQYNYPIQFSTKIAQLPEKYFEILNPDIHAFQISIMGLSDEYIRKWEKNTPTATERLDFVKLLLNKGFWAGIRIQPIIDIEECVKLCKAIGYGANYVTLEHFKSIWDTKATDYFFELVNNKADLVPGAGKLQFRRDTKIKNIMRLQEILNSYGVRVGVGDNDLHYLSQSRCCCGIDTIGKAFNNYLKYNLTYMSTGDFPENCFIPKCNPRKHINDQKFGLNLDCKQYVEDYISNHRDWCGPKRQAVENKLFGISKNTLF